MRIALAGVAAALAVLTSATAEAGFCGAASYNCCPQVACQPTACYTACRVERQTCFRTVSYTVRKQMT